MREPNCAYTGNWKATGRRCKKETEYLPRQRRILRLVIDTVLAGCTATASDQHRAFRECIEGVEPRLGVATQILSDVDNSTTLLRDSSHAISSTE